MPAETDIAIRIRTALADYLKRERAYVAAAGRELSEAGPFRKTDESS